MAARQLIDEAAVQDQAADPQGAPGDIRATGIPPGMEDQIGAQEVPATPEEEQQLEQAKTKMLKMVHGRQSRDHVIDMLNDRDVPAQAAIGRVAAQIVGTIEEQAKAGGTQLDTEFLMNLGVLTVKELLDTGIAGGFYKIKEGSPEYDQVMKMAVLEGVKAHGDKVLQSPDGQKLSQDAQNLWAQKAAEEVDSGTADPKYLAMTRGGGQASDGSRQLMQEQ
jgi:hypothetical protein